MADPFSIVQSIIGLLVQINDMLGTFRSNKEDCGRIHTLVATAQAVVEPLKQMLKATDNKGVSAALKGLKDALDCSLKVVVACQKKSVLGHAIKASSIAGDLRRVYEDILANVVLVDLANSINNTTMLSDIRKILADDLRAKDAYSATLEKILGIVAAHPDICLRREVEKLVQPYHSSTEYPSDQTKKERKTDLATRSEVNIPAADINGSRASLLSDGSAKSTSEKSVVGRDGHRPVKKDSSHRSNTADGAGSSKKKGNKIKKVDGPITTGSKVKSEKINAPADRNGSCASELLYAKSTSVKSVNVQGHPNTDNKIILTSTEKTITSTDPHPAKPWIVTGHEEGTFSIWDFEKQKTVMERQVNKAPGNFANFMHKISRYVKEKAAPHWVCSVKFIIQEKWLAVGDGSGYIHVYTYTDTKLDKVKEFRAGHGESVDSLAVHPTDTYLLSSSAYGRKINLWDWSKGWMQIQKFDVKSTYLDGVLSLKFNPRDANTFACVTDDKRLLVGNIESSSLTTKLEGQSLRAADYFFTRSRQHLMATLKFRSQDAEIWDLETGEVVHTLGESGQKTRHISGHPTLPILVTALDDGTVCFWDACTYRLERKVHIMDSPIHDLVLFTDVNDITRLVITSESMIAVMEVNLPRANTSGWTGVGNYG